MRHASKIAFSVFVSIFGLLYLIVYIQSLINIAYRCVKPENGSFLKPKHTFIEPTKEESSTLIRIPKIPRESATYIILRRKGLSINLLSRTFGRSKSYIHRILKFNGLTKKDLRKIPARVRRLAAQRNRFLMENLRQKWEMWIFGEGEEPP
jgi:hypothetical protein